MRLATCTTTWRWKCRRGYRLSARRSICFVPVGLMLGRPMCSATLAGLITTWESPGKRWTTSTRPSLYIARWGIAPGKAGRSAILGQCTTCWGKQREALDYYKQALPIQRAIGDRSGEAATLINIGVIYRELGEWQEALDRLNQALALKRVVMDRYGEGVALNNIGVVYDSLGEAQKALDYLQSGSHAQKCGRGSSGESVHAHQHCRDFTITWERCRRPWIT